jgi:hypothetical protein
VADAFSVLGTLYTRTRNQRERRARAPGAPSLSRVAERMERAADPPPTGASELLGLLASRANESEHQIASLGAQVLDQARTITLRVPSEPG